MLARQRLQNLDGAAGQGHTVFAAGFRAAGGNGPYLRGKIDFVPLRVERFAPSERRQDNQLDRSGAHAVPPPQLRHECREFGMR